MSADKSAWSLPRRWDPWLLLGMAFLFDVALVMRLWDLERHPFPVFDEVYFPKNAKDYLDGKTVFDAHPPLGKYFIVLGILLFGRNETGYRFMTALFGALVPVLVAGVIYRLTYRRGLALL
ncbi:MAG: phospholipid carrier-dependent glycosyltransferase, partial [Thermostichales cyanobacterium SZTDM-1c_bins_54]